MAKVIMIQGTMSNSGKSFLTAALCRIFWQDGYRTAPFKSQNMALNSYITADGLEIGRAQAVQAQAAGIAPDVRMNPVLLKPSSDTGSQVIVHGEVRGQMPAAEYYRYKKQLIPEVLAAYESLAAEYDVIVIEGAGSPAEINLRTDDIVNMGLALRVNAPVLLAGDIDRGGVFAQLYGTVALLEEEERAAAAQEAYHIPKRYTSMDQMLADPAVDIVLNLTRPSEHYAVTKAALLAVKENTQQGGLGLIQVGHGFDGHQIRPGPLPGQGDLLEIAVGPLEGEASHRLQQLAQGAHVQGYLYVCPGGGLPGDGDGGGNHLVHRVSGARQLGGAGAEGVGADDLASGLDVLPEDGVQQVRAGEVEQVRLAAGGQAPLLQHGAHGPVPNGDFIA